MLFFLFVSKSPVLGYYSNTRNDREKDEGYEQLY